MERAARKRPIWQYVALVVVFLAAAVYQGRTIVARFPQWFGQGRAQWPFFLQTDTTARFVFTSTTRIAGSTAPPQ